MKKIYQVDGKIFLEKEQAEAYALHDQETAMDQVKDFCSTYKHLNKDRAPGDFGCDCPNFCEKRPDRNCPNAAFAQICAKLAGPLINITEITAYESIGEAKL